MREKLTCTCSFPSVWELSHRPYPPASHPCPCPDCVLTLLECQQLYSQDVEGLQQYQTSLGSW
jgi:hypothetical protein